MDASGLTKTVEFTHFHFFCGLGAAAKGMNKGHARVGSLRAKFRCIGGIDNNRAAVKDFGRLAGVPGTEMDLFDLEQYLAFHGHEPPAGWREAMPVDIRIAAHGERPNIVFLSAPCKGFSGLLPETSSKTPKYQALNRLTLRGVWLALEAWKDDPPELFVFENVPRIAKRGRHLLDQICALFRAYGYAVAETDHDCGEIGGLAQSRKRFLLVARHEAKVPPFLYEPEKHRLLGVGEVLEKFPLPGHPAGGPMHRVPSLQWKTWIRLAFVEAGADWRSLNKLAVENGFLRDYGVAGQIGLEPSLGEHLEVMVEVFREVRRILKPHGTVWLNYGDCYAAAPNGKSAAAYKADGSDDRTFRDKPFSTVGPIHRGKRMERGEGRWGGGNNPAGGVLKPKDLCMIPNRLAIALQEDGWWARSEIIWNKPNPMPESVYDRPTVAHEKLFLLTKAEDYYYNHEAIREPVTGGAHARKPGPNSRQNVGRVPRSRKFAREDNAMVKSKRSFAEGTSALVETKNARNVWTIAPKAFREAHFATFPPALAERCVLAGTPPNVCACCGAVSGCGPICEVFGTTEGTVFDPFGGAGTVGLVAAQLGRRSIMTELNPEYADIAQRRIEKGAS